MSHVMACIDASPAAPAVCDYAAWASQRLQAPLSVLHVLDQVQYPQQSDLSGTIGLGSREHLLEELAELDQKRSKLALEQGHLMLEAARQRLAAAGVADVQLRQRHGELVDSLAELQQDIRLLVIGRQGEASASLGQQVGSHLENAIRTLARPILVSCGEFKAPQSYMFAYDGSATARKGIEQLAASPLLKGLPCHLVLVGADTGDAWEQLKAAERSLQDSASEVRLAIRAGEVEATLHAYQAEHGIDLLVMGAYGHSRIRQFLVGSTTSHLLRSSAGALLILR
ncbi:universal stress protein [Pseudomonas lalucatii]|uniref:Universal stress protein n=1 Tax=Pseudomonas lalucatii TaxID=1424203 RepID=A0ABS5Q0H7_9PSED|nr:universal stress protein [Pseudomonas lalucatii]MBS7662154.1 universal stress protein [Pseudomonas lalucatii]MBS7690441.1 universal stress protein [Pseudomonas lalucatii]MBS7726079.1 universal stress protein [Pseudomonas lalucatii]QVM88350.1 universal stress protein [Pseudomonas lalucatii]